VTSIFAQRLAIYIYCLTFAEIELFGLTLDLAVSLSPKRLELPLSGTFGLSDSLSPNWIIQVTRSTKG